MKKYKRVWVTAGEYGKFYVYTKAGVNYICRPPNAREDAIARAKEIRIGNAPIYLLSHIGGYSEEVVS